MALPKPSPGLLPAENYSRFGRAFEAIDALAQGLQALGAGADATDQALARDIAALRDGAALTDKALSDRIGALVDRVALINAGLYAGSRPGDTPSAFTSSVAGGDPGAAAPLDLAAYPIRVVAYGLGVEVANSREVWTRKLYPIQPAQVFRAFWTFVRTVNPQDPADDAVAGSVAWYGPNRNLLRVDRVALATPYVADGPTKFSAFLGDSGVEGVTAPRPAGAAYFKLGFNAFGNEARTVLTDLGALDSSSLDTLSLEIRSELSALGEALAGVGNRLTREAQLSAERDDALGSRIEGLDLATLFARTTMVEGGANDAVAIADPAGFIIALFSSLGIQAPSFIGSAFEGKSFSLQDAAAAAIALGLVDPNGFVPWYIDRAGDFQGASISVSGSNDPGTILAVTDPAGFALLTLSARDGLRVAGPSSGNVAKLDPLGLPPMPVNSRIAWFGDSLFGRGKYDDDPLIGNTGWGMTTWAKTVCGSCWYESPGNNFGVSGNTLDEMIPRLPLLAEARPDLAVVLAGTNSVSTSSDRDMIRKLNIIFGAILANIPRLVVVKMIPRYDAGWTAEHEGRRKRVNAWIETQASDRLVVLDIEATVTPALLADGIHPMSPQAAYVVGKRIGDFLAKFIASKAVNMMAGVRTGFAPNPQMGGTGGDKQAKTSATPVPTGVVANGYVLIADGGVTATASKVYDEFGNEGQRIVLSGTHVGTNVDILLAVSGDLSSGAPKAGDAIEAFVEFTVRGAPVGVAAIAASSIVYTAGYAAAIGALRTWVAMDRAIDIIPPGLVDRRTVMRSPPKVLNSGAPAIVPQAVVISLQNSASPAPVSLTLDLWGMNTRTVPSRI